MELVNKIRLSCPQKSIWLYTGYTWENVINYESWFKKIMTGHFWVQDFCYMLRKEIIKNCNVLVDGKYIDSQRDITLKWRGSSNQRVIDVKQSLRKGEVVLWTK